jgi:hypothetical protein
MHREEVMSHLILKGDNTTCPGFSLLGENTLSITFDETGGALHLLELRYLVLSRTTSVNIASTGTPGGFDFLRQLAENDDVLTTVTISGSERFELGLLTGQSNSGDGVVTDIAATATSPTKIHSSLTLIDASTTTGKLFACGSETSAPAAFFRPRLRASSKIISTGF